MLSRVSRSFKPLSHPTSWIWDMRIVYCHSQITKQLGFTDTFHKVTADQLCKAIRQKLNKKQKDSFLRLQIFAGQGCEGFTYKFKFDNQLKDSDYVYKLKTQPSQQQPKIVFATNGEEMKLLKGATIDYAEEMMREVFYVKENPNAEISCSCKTSFSPKDYVF